MFNFAAHLEDILIKYYNKLNYVRSSIERRRNIEKALKKFKRKFEKTGVVKELRSRQAFAKPSVVKRKQNMRAVYVQQLQLVEE